MVRKKTKKTYRVDLSDVQDNTPPPEGSYHVSVEAVEAKEGNEDTYFAWKLKIESGKFKGKLLYTNTSLATQSLWNLRGLLEALEVDIPDEAFDLDLEEMVGGEMMVSVDHEDYRGKPKARVTDFWPMKGAKDDEEEDEPKRGKKRAKDEDDEEEAPKRRSRKAKDEEDEEDEAPKRRRAKVEDDEEEEEDEPPKRSKKGSSKKKAEPPSQAEIKDMSQDELEDVIKEFELDVDLSKLKTLRKMQLAVIDELEG